MTVRALLLLLGPLIHAVPPAVPPVRLLRCILHAILRVKVADNEYTVTC